MLTKFVQKQVQQHQLLQNGDIVVLGVSGGTDSLALFHLLYRLKDDLHVSLHVATLDHGLRGNAGLEDAQFVKRLADSWHVPCTLALMDVQAIADRQKISIETAARQARYEFLADVAHKVGAECVAVAHHMDDQAETILMHLLRGTGLQGLQGMQMEASMPNHPRLRLIRPLLNVTREQLEAYCQENDLHPREDHTNYDTAYFRNQIRLEILPLLKTVNPQITQMFSRLSDAAHVDLMFIQKIFEEQLLPYCRYATGHIQIERQRFLELHPALQRRFVMYALGQLNSQSTYSYEQITQAVAIATRGQVGAISQFPAQLRLRVDYQWIVVEKSGNNLTFPITGCYLPKDTEVLLTVPSTTQLNDVHGNSWQCVVTNSLRNENCDAQLSIPDLSYIKLRTRKAGDRFKPMGLGGGSKKLKDWMIDRKIPQYLRDHIPLLEVNGEIALVLMENERFIGEDYKVRDGLVNKICFLIRNS